MKVAALLVCLLFPVGAIAAPVVFVNVNVIPMTEERVLREHVVIVDRGVIREVGPASSVIIPADAIRIDGQGGFLIPGLIDLHTHVHEMELPLYLAGGVTTILDAGGGLMDLRRRMADGDDAPEMIPCGRSLRGISSAAEAERVLDHQQAAGYGCIKIYSDISKEALVALIDGARKRKMLSIGHIPRNLVWQDMLSAKPDAIAHAEEFLYSPVETGDDYIIAGQALRHGVSIITTLVTYDLITRQVADVGEMLGRGELRYMSPVFLRTWRRPLNRYRTIGIARVADMRRLLDFQKRLVKKLHDAGVPILLGTDAGGPPFVLPGWSAIEELRQLVSSGLAPYDALRGATAGAAGFLRRADIGTIQPGTRADLVLLRGDPLRDIDNISLRAGVMVRGRWLDQPALQTMLEQLARANRVEEEFVRLVESEGVAKALDRAGAMGIRVESLDELGWQLLRIEGRAEDALRVFRANAAIHPHSPRAKQSLAEAEGSRKN